MSGHPSLFEFVIILLIVATFLFCFQLLNIEEGTQVGGGIIGAAIAEDTMGDSVEILINGREYKLFQGDDLTILGDEVHDINIINLKKDYVQVIVDGKITDKLSKGDEEIINGIHIRILDII